MKELLEAIEHDSLVKMRALLEQGLDLSKPVIIGEEYELDEPDEIGLLFYAIRTGASLEAIELLLEYGLDIHQLDDDKISALDTAIKFKRKDIVQLCIDKGVDLNSTKRKSGILPLLLASCFNDTEMVELLLEHGADLNATDASGMSAKDYAKKLGQKKMVDFLDEKGAKFNLYPNE
ncbi:ankyrin repeat domain-containing protein [Sulfurovum sp.]|uniref:ankyrin repeat domain-containing protein n=1 Tax=Sulfurovum sp. TaxID=1969726 RepID=UPI0025FD0037|nr:ankyrin repeat domain-containing protein [Sulfurovum sp.]